MVVMVVAQCDPPCSQEHKWQELEEQRQAQKLQRQLQQEQAYLLSLQRQQSLDSKKPAQQHSAKPSLTLDLDRPKQLQNTLRRFSLDSERTWSTQNHSLEKTADPKLQVLDLQSAAPDFEPIREVNPRSSLLSY